MVKKPFWKWLRQLPKEFWEVLKKPVSKAVAVLVSTVILFGISMEIGRLYHWTGYLLILPVILMFLYGYWMLANWRYFELQNLETPKIKKGETDE